MEKPQMRLSFGSNWSPVVKVIIILNTLVYLAFLVAGSQTNTALGGISYRNLMLAVLSIDPNAIIHHYAFWQPASYLFVHETFYHFLFNMLGLWWFGSDVERAMGSKSFLRYYFFTGICAGLVSVAMNMPTIGASGAIYGLLLAYGLIFPDRVLYLYFVIPIKAKYCVILFGIVEVIAAMLGEFSNVNHMAHLGGIFFGLLWFLYWSKKDILISKFRDYQKQQRRKKFRVITTVESTEESFKAFDEKPTIH